jgi:diguanylate cyclase (GGDEF)-like protein/PAS domain S-box-containing protein
LRLQQVLQLDVAWYAPDAPCLGVFGFAAGSFRRIFHSLPTYFLNGDDDPMSAATDNSTAFALDAEPPMAGPAAAFGTWPGPAIEVLRDGTLTQANRLGGEVAPAMLAGEDGALRGLISLAFETGGSVSDRVEVARDGKQSWFECVVLPVDAERALVLARDETYNLNVRQALFESRQRYRDLVVISSDFAWETDANGVFVFVSPHGAMGYSAADLVGHHPIEFVIDNEVDISDLPFSTRTPLTNAQVWMRGGEGQEACLLASAVPVVDHDGTWRGARGLCRDVTEERLRDSALAQAKVREQVVAYIVNQIREQAQPAAMLEAAVAMLGRAESASAAVYRRQRNGEYELAATHDDWPADLVIELILPTSGDLTEPFRSSAAGFRTMASITHYRGVPNGAVVLARPDSTKPWSGDDEAMLGAVAGQLAIALRQIADQNELERLSSTDGLTGLMNRRAFQDSLDTAIERARRNETPGALIYVDLDNFKAINDNYGHETGDNILNEVAQILSSRSRTYDLVARIGGDEFVVWLDGVDFAVAKRRAGELAMSLAELSRYSGEGLPKLGASVGIVEFDANCDGDTRELVARADRAMYDVKAHNKQNDDVAIGAVPAERTIGSSEDLVSLSDLNDTQDGESS